MFNLAGLMSLYSLVEIMGTKRTKYRFIKLARLVSFFSLVQNMGTKRTKYVLSSWVDVFLLSCSNYGTKRTKYAKN
jgi:hypothetical protein